MNKEDQEPDNNPKPQSFTPSKKVFDVVRPGKSAASATSRPIISSHKPQVPDDQFVPSANTRLAGNPSEKRDLMDGGKKLALSPLSEEAAPEEGTTPTEATPEIAPGETTAPILENKDDQSAEPQDTPELLPDHFDDEESAPTLPAEPAPTAEPVEKQEELPPAPAEKPTPEQLAVGQVVTTDDDVPMTQDDVLAETDAPTLDRAVVSHHKHRTKLWEWLLIFLLIVALALVALNFLLDAEVLTTDLGIPHTDLLKD